MKANSLTENKGLSLSQAQSISNLCNQRAIEIQNKLNSINNCEKVIEVKGVNQIIERGVKIPDNIIDLIKEKAKLHACQAFLMENITAKENMLKSAKTELADVSGVVIPEEPKQVSPYLNQLSLVNESWGWEQLTVNEINEYLEAEAFAAHIGQFIHKGQILDSLRNELNTIPSIEWMEINKDTKSPVIINVHHTSEELISLHEKLSAEHRNYESRVNYYKAKVKNLVTYENSRISKINADAQIAANKINDENMATYKVEYNKAISEINKIQSEFEEKRHENIKKIASMRISIDGRFQQTIDSFLKTIPTEE
jgi:hypothetical protein